MLVRETALYVFLVIVRQKWHSAILELVVTDPVRNSTLKEPVSVPCSQMTRPTTSWLLERPTVLTVAT